MGVFKFQKKLRVGLSIKKAIESFHYLFTYHPGNAVTVSLSFTQSAINQILFIMIIS